MAKSPSKCDQFLVPSKAHPPDKKRDVDLHLKRKISHKVDLKNAPENSKLTDNVEYKEKKSTKSLNK